MTMRHDAFEALLDRHGADPKRWPEELRAEALALATSDSRAARQLEAAGRVDAAFAGPATLPSALRGRLARPPAPEAERSAGWLGLPRLAWSLGGIAAAASLVLGVTLGSLTPPTIQETGDADLAAWIVGPDLNGEEP